MELMWPIKDISIQRFNSVTCVLSIFKYISALQGR
jgi:hypothetical protein